jgi:hypothetical protein
MHVTTAQLAKFLNCRSPHLQRTAGQVRFTLVLGVDEGINCRFALGNWDDPRLGEIAVPLALAVGWKHVEHAPSRQVVLRCTVTGEDLVAATCSIDLGAGFVPLPVIEEAS